MTTNRKTRRITWPEVAIWILLGVLSFGAAYSFVKAFGG